VLGQERIYQTKLPPYYHPASFTPQSQTWFSKTKNSQPCGAFFGHLEKWLSGCSCTKRIYMDFNRRSFWMSSVYQWEAVKYSLEQAVRTGRTAWSIFVTLDLLMLKAQNRTPRSQFQPLLKLSNDEIQCSLLVARAIRQHMVTHADCCDHLSTIKQPFPAHFGSLSVHSKKC